MTELGESPLIVPPPLRPGDRIQVVAPSSHFDRTLVWRGLGWLAERYRVGFEPSLFAREGMFAGDDQRRLGELSSALADPEVRAIVGARGGYGASRIAHRVDWFRLRRDPKWLVGFSDLTTLHVEATRVGVASLHAQHVAGLGRGDAVARAEWVAALEQPARRRCFRPLTVLHAGRARGILTGGNLTLLFTAAAAGRLELPEPCLLMLEDTGEPCYRIDRMLTALLVSGHLDRVAGVVLGQFTECPPGRFELEAVEVVARRLGELEVPMLAGLEVGHGRHNHPLPLGLDAEIDGRCGLLTICPDAPE